MASIDLKGATWCTWKWGNFTNIQNQINTVQGLNSPFSTLLNRAEVKYYDAEQFKERPHSIVWHT